MEKTPGLIVARDVVGKIAMILLLAGVGLMVLFAVLSAFNPRTFDNFMFVGYVGGFFIWLGVPCLIAGIVLRMIAKRRYPVDMESE